jgi:hypothetical protein
MSVIRRYTFSFALATIVLIVLLGMRPIATETILAGYAIVLAAIALAAAATAMREAQRDPGSRFELELTRERIEPSRPTELVRMERELTLAMANAGHVHDRFLPLLRDIADARGPVDDETAAFLHAQTPPADRNASGLSLRRIRSLIEALERA